MTFRMIGGLVLLAAALLAEDAAAIRELDGAWRKAVLAKNLAGLGAMLADDLVYAHASGVVDTKGSYLEKLKSGKQVYQTMDQKNVSARIYGDTGVTHSWMRVTGVNAQGPFDDKVMMLHVWVKKGGKWVLAGHQTTRVDKLPD